MRKLIYLNALLLILIGGCTKEVTTDLATSINSNEESNAAAADTYLPLKNGTYWKYNNETDAKALDESKLTVLNFTKTFIGKTYKAVKIEKDKRPDTVYYNQTGHSYYLFTNESTQDANTMKLEILFLKDNVSNGATWSEDAGFANGTALNCYGKILEKNMTIKVEGETYDNVIHSYVELRKKILFFYITVAKQDYYVAKNIGIIKNISTQLLPDKSTTTTTITDYLIK